MKYINQFITEYIIKKKLDKAIDSEDHYIYFPKTKEELIKNIQKLFSKDETNLNCIDTSAITDMSLVFGQMPKIHGKDFDVSEWDVTNVTNMEGLFANCANFNCDLSKWDVSKVKDMSGMFSWCVKFNCDLSNWDVSNANNMDFMFYSCENFNCDLSSWDVSNVTNMICMFKFCKNFTGEGLENWNISNVTYMNDIFGKCTLLKNKPSWYKK